MYVNSLIENPAFDSQTKDTLTTQVKKFGSRCDLPADYIKKLSSKKMGIVDAILAFAAFKGRKVGKVAKKTRNISGIPKLDDANKAGTSESKKCTLILTEGDSAKTLAISGMSIVGRVRCYAFFR